MQKVKFSVVIPVYNKEKHIKRALNSVLNQSYQNFEVIVVCDPSTDNSNEIVEKMAIEDSRIKILYRDLPGPGGYAARNLGIENSKGKWIAFLDADDEWMPNHLQKMSELAQTYPEAFMLGSSWQIYDKQGVRKLDKYSRKNPKANSHLVDLKSYLREGNHGSRPIHTSVACVRRDSPVVSELFILHPEVKRGGDLFAWLKMMAQHRCMAWSNHIGAVYYLDADNMVTKTASSTAYLMSKVNFDALSASMSKEEKRLLQRYFNRWIRNDWRSNIRRKAKNFSLLKALYWHGDFAYCTVSFLSSWLQKIKFK